MGRSEVIMTRVAANHASGGHTIYLVETPSGVLYQVAVNALVDASYQKSTDGGITWSDDVSLYAGTLQSLSCWYDRWSGIAAGLIHVAYCDSTTGNILYRSIDTENSDTLSTQTTVFDGLVAAGGGNLSITRTRGGNLLCYGMINAGTEGGLYRSTDVGGTWAPKALPEALATTDQIIMLPGWAADNQDGMAFFWDASANEISRYLYDDSADSWAETSIATSMTDTVASTSAPHFAATVDITNSQNLLVAWSAVDTANADLRCWKVTESAITEVTNVVLNSTDDQGLAAIGICTTNQWWYVAYGGKSDGSETWSTSLKYYYKVSTDGGTTWGAETVMSTRLFGVRWMATAPRFVRPFGIVFYISTSGTYILYNSAFAQPHARSIIGV